MADQNNNAWKELFEWSLKVREGGPQATDYSTVQPLPKSQQQWIEEALKSAMVDLSSRLRDIKTALDEGENDKEIHDQEVLLDELLEMVEYIDQAKDLAHIGGLPVLLKLLSSPAPSLRWKAAEVLATCAQNNPDVQTQFIDCGVLSAIWPLLDDVDDTCQVKGVLAVSCIIRGYDPAINWFKKENGPEKLCSMMSRPNARLQRKCLQLLEYLLTQTSREGMDSVICMCQAELPALCGCGDEQVKHAAENLQAAMKPPNIAC